MDVVRHLVGARASLSNVFVVGSCSKQRCHYKYLQMLLFSMHIVICVVVAVAIILDVATGLVRIVAVAVASVIDVVVAIVLCVPEVQSELLL